jgi:hypothetical protein
MIIFIGLLTSIIVCSGLAFMLWLYLVATAFVYCLSNSNKLELTVNNLPGSIISFELAKDSKVLTDFELVLLMLSNRND